MNSPDTTVPRTTPAALSHAARGLFAHEPRVPRLMQTYRPFISPFHTLLPLFPRGSRVLDIGCGRGLLLTLLAHAGRIASGTGFDVAPDAVDAAERTRQRLPAAQADRLRFVYCPLGTAWPDGTYDVVSLVDVLHHVPRPHQEAMVREALSRVAPGGLFIYKDMCRAPFWRAAMNRLHDLVVAKQWINYCAVEDVERWASDAGFTLDVRSNHAMWWYGHELRVFRKS